MDGSACVKRLRARLAKSCYFAREPRNPVRFGLDATVVVTACTVVAVTATAVAMDAIVVVEAGWLA